MKIAEIKQNLNIDSVLSYYGLKPDKNNRLNCPWHPDKTPSLQIYPKTGTWTCFSSNCNAGSGDMIDFIMKYEAISKYEAIKRAESLILPTLPVSPKEVQQPVETKKPALAMDRLTTLNHAFSYFKSGIRSLSQSTKAYLDERKLNRDLLEIGYNSGQFHHRENNIHIPCYVNVHLLNNNPSGGYRVFAKHCLIFPLRNRKNQIVSLYGRSTVSKDNSSRHYYLKNTQGLYPEYPSEHTRKLIVPESIIDTASLQQSPSITGQYGLLSAYGTNGLTQEHLEAIKDLPDLEEIIFFFDGDDAGRKAVIKYAEQLRFLLPSVKISNVETPDKEDVNSLYVSKGESLLVQLIEKRKTLYAPAKEKGFTTQPEEKETYGSPKFNSTNHEALTYETSDFHFTVLGGIKISGLERMKVTLKLQVKTSHYLPLRQHLDLYNNDQLTRLIRTVNEQLDVKTETIKTALLDLIEHLEHYRIDRINQMQTIPEESQAIPPGELTEAENYLKGKKLMERTMKDLGKTGIVGEHHNRMIMFLVFLSRISEEPLHIISFGASGTGKTHLQEGISKLLPEEGKLEITSMSGNALYYLQNDEIRNKVLLIEDMDGAQEVLYPLRELQTKQKITKRVSIKDTQGNIKTIQVTVRGPVCIAGCTTRSRVYEDNANRSILIYIDGSAQQDERIMAYQRAESAGTINKEEELKYQKLLCNVQRVIRPLKVVNPYAPELKIPSNVFKKRRSNWIYLRFIETVTLYHRYQREQQADKQTGEVFIETTLEDIAWANKLLKDILIRKSDELTEPVRNFFERLKKWLQDEQKEQFRTGELKTSLQITASSLKRYLSELTTCGHIKITAGNKTRGYTYEITSYEEYKQLRYSVDHALDSLLDHLKRKEAAK